MMRKTTTRMMARGRLTPFRIFPRPIPSRFVSNTRTGSSNKNPPTEKLRSDKLKRTSSSSKKHLNLHEVIKDSYGCVMYEPGKELTTTSSYKSTPDGSFRRELPILRASALLDTREYCIQSANASTSKSGTDAAKRLLRGKRDIVQFLRRHQSSQAFCLQGHGIPVQLLQDHIDMADALLSSDASTLSFRQTSTKIQVRFKEGTYGSRTWQASEALTFSMQLYLTAMDRLAASLGIVFDRPSVDDPTEFEDEYENAFQEASLSSQVAQSWNVQLLRGFSSDALPVPHVAPVVEFSGPQQLGIRLQGYPTQDGSLRRKKRQAVTLSYEADFRVPTTIK